MIAVCKITIEQMKSKSYSNRDKTYILDFVNSIDISSSWKNLTDTCKIILPKNVYVSTEFGNVAWADADLYANTTTPPIFLRGDKITVELGYEYQNSNNEWVTETNVEFTGYITKINPKIPMEIECEDNMWLLKQAQCPNKVFKASEYNTTTIIQYLLNNATVGADNPYLNDVIIPMLKTFNVVDGVGSSQVVTTSVGDFRTQNETIGGVLNRLRNDYKLECFFRGNDLFVSGIVYYPDDYLKGNVITSIAYDFEQNITENDMVYSRKDDIRLGIKAYSVNKKELTTLNSKGKPKTKQVRLETTVGDPDGEIRTQYFWDVKDVTTLKDLATQRLNKLKYEGWKGKFTSFGLPFVRHGQAVSLKSTVTPERQGTYLVKAVNVKFTHADGFKRTIDPHIRIDSISNLTYQDFINGL